MATNVPFGPETLISVKVIVEKNTRKFKIPFSELGPDVLPAQLRSLLDIPDGIPIKFQRWSDSGSSYEELDPSDTGVFKKLARAARAKLKLRIKAVVPPLPTLSPYNVPSQHPALASEVTLTNVNGALNGLPSPDIVPPLRNSLTSDVTINNNSRISLASTSSQLSAIAPAALFRAPIQQGLTFPSPPQTRDLTVRPKSEKMPLTIPTVVAAHPAGAWSVYCNVCDKPAANEHYHCTICDNGDYDLCQSCVEAGHHCPGEGHWLVKRTIKDGRVVNSTTETVSKPKPTVSDPPSEMPGAYTDDKKVEAEEEQQQPAQPSRTCNSCVRVFTENCFVTCQDCEDFDLCLPCHEGNKHGHHPGHTFRPAVAGAALSTTAAALCAAGRNVRHAAICDGCDRTINGVRHKCLICPDWDYCSECIKTARYKHPNHRFAALYDPIPEPHFPNPRHVGIYCDGPLCESKHDYISGTRFKCAICNDTDFCGNCEASPRNFHNRTHPLIKFKTPVRNVSVTTMGEDKHGAPIATMGDKVPFVRPTAAANTPSPVRTVADVKPTEAPIVASIPVPKTTEKIQIKDLLAEPIEEKIKVEDLKPTPALISTQELNAHYVRDTVKDGSAMTPSQKFVQVWTLRNPGPHAWPAGCVVSFVGGDRMFNIDDAHPSSEADLTEAQRSNVVCRAVEVGEEIAFRVLMKAPKQEGTAISYWRLKAADGVAFGHRLWCHIKVAAAQLPAAFATPSAPVPVSVASVERAEPSSSSDNKEDFLTQLLRNHEEQLHLEQNKAVQAAKQHAETEAKMKVELEEKESRIQMLYDLQKQLKAFHMGAMEGHHKVAALSKQQKQVQARMISALKSRLDLEVSKRRQREESEAAELSATTPSVKVEPVPATVETEDGKTEGSAMIFPKLDKESPAASTHESVETAREQATPETKHAVLATVVSPSAKTETETDIFEDAESVELLDSSDDDGFLTDEEYEILDASDEENNA